MTPWGCSIQLYPDECRLEIPARGIDAKLLVATSNHMLVNLAESEETGTERDMTEGTAQSLILGRFLHHHTFS